MKATVAITIILLTSVSFAEEVRKDIPDTAWEPIFFKEIDKVTTRGGIAALREKTLDKNDLEFRLWAGFGLSRLNGLIIERINDTWRVCYLYSSGKEFGTVMKKDVEASHPWPQIWDKLTELGVLTLPDASKLKPDGVHVRDGISYVVEFQANGMYRTYMYSNPGHHKWPEAAKISQIVMLLGKELSLPFYQSPGTFPDTVKNGQVILIRKGKVLGAFQLFDQHVSGNDRSEDTAKVKWVYRTDGKTEFYSDGVITGDLEVKGRQIFIEFGPFSVRWSSAGDGKGYIYYPDVNGTQAATPDREYVAITDLNEIGKLDAADTKWDYKASYIDLPEDK